MKALTAETLPYPPAVLPPEPDPRTICRTCGEVKSRKNFQFGSDGKRTYADCQDCRRKQMIAAGVAMYEQQRQEQLQEFVGAVNQQRGIAHVTQLANTMSNQTGGLEGFCAFWWGTILKASEERKYKPVLDGCNAIKNLFVEASKHSKETRKSSI